MLSFFGSFFLTDSASLFFCYHGRTLPFIDGVFSRNQVNSTLRGVRAFAVFFSFFYFSYDFDLLLALLLPARRRICLSLRSQSTSHIFTDSLFLVLFHLLNIRSDI